MNRFLFSLCVVLVCQTGLQAQMLYPISVATDGKQTFVADLNLPGVWKLEAGKAELEIEGAKRFREPLNRIRCVAIDRDGKLLAGDSATREVFRIEDGKPVPLTDGEIGIPMSIATRSSGEIIVADLELARVYAVPAAGGEPKLIAAIPAPRGVFVDKDDAIWVVSGLEDPIRKIDKAGEVSVVVAGRPFKYPSSIVVDASGTAFVCDSYEKCVWRVAEGKEPERFSEGSFVHPVSLSIDGENLLLADPRANAIFQIDSSGKATKLIESKVEEAATEKIAKDKDEAAKEKAAAE